MKAGWQTKTLGELCLIRTGKKDVNQGNPNGEYPFFTCAAKNTYSDSFSFDTEALLIAGNGDVGQVSYYKGKFEAYQRTYVITDFVNVLPRFLYFILDDKLKETVSKQKLGNTMPYIKVGMLTDFPVHLPPIPEQQRIVAILDEASEGIATATANAEKNLKNARELFDSTLQSVFTRKGDGWNERQLGELATFRNGINFTKTSKGDTVKILGVKDFQNNFLAPLDNFDTVTTDGTLPDSDMLKANDILFVRSNGNMELIGRCLLVGAVTERITFSGFTIRARLNDGSLNARYLCHFLKSKTARRKLIDGGNGANIKSLNQTTLSTLAIPFPPDVEQARIVTMLDELSTETKNLEAIYQQKLVALEELKKSILNQAFSGQLH